jgi:hypothetical protein
MSRSPSFHLSERDLAVARTVERFGLVSAGQVERLFFSDGSDKTRNLRTNRTLRRLVEHQRIKRVYQMVGSEIPGATGFIYTSYTRNLRDVRGHMQLITELFVRLAEHQAAGHVAEVRFTPEPYCHVQMGHLLLAPDGRIQLDREGSRYHWWLEVDRSTEWRMRIMRKLKNYAMAYDRWAGVPLPARALRGWKTPTGKKRSRTMVDRQHLRKLYTVCQFGQAIPTLTGGPNG